MLTIFQKKPSQRGGKGLEKAFTFFFVFKKAFFMQKNVCQL